MTLKLPLGQKYNCPSQTTWKLSINSLILVLQVGLPVARANAAEFITIWAELANTLEAFLFPSSKAPPTQTLEEQQADEAYDVKVVEMIRDSILPYPNEMPKEFVLQIVSLLNKGSIHSTANDSPIDTDSTRKLKEEFARTCFETLLQFSFLGPKGNPNLFIQSNNKVDTTNAFEVGLVNKLAVTSLLQRFRDVVIKYLEDERLSGKCPLARHRVAEISFVLKALATLVSSLKKAPIETVEDGVWDQLIALYPHLVDCTTSNCAQVNRSLREVLHEYKDLLAPPKKFTANGNGQMKTVHNGV
ncbi:Protein MON2 -like protein [Halotydeus destructor]|nr:Protein MON2 -like protein [Halotydeus destructor]